VIYLKTSVGIEIRQEDLLISCLRSNFAGGVFTNFQQVSEYRQRDPQVVRGEIDSFFRREKISRENIVLGIPRKDVILRYLEMPKEVEDNLRQVMFYQVQSFEPTEEEKLYFDFAPLKNGQGGKKLHVLLLMVRKSILDAHLEVMKHLGIRPAAITIGSVALANMFLGTQAVGSGKIHILADLRPGGLELAVLRDGALIYAREAIRQEGMAWKQLLLNEMEVAFGKVRLDPEQAIEAIVMTGEESETIRREIEADVPGCELMGNRLRFEMSPQNRRFLQQAATSLGLAYAGISHRLSMRLNLLPVELRAHQKRWAYIPTVVLSLAILVALAGLGFHQMIQERILIRKLDQEIQSLKGAVERVQALRTRAEGLEKQLGSIEGLLNRRDRNLEILQEMTALLPADTYLKIYRNSDCSVTINGDSTSPPDLIAKLEKSPLLRDVVQQGAVFRNPQSGKDTFTFLAKCEK
jgi:Tfp pilus assembly protein PilN